MLRLLQVVRNHIGKAALSDLARATPMTVVRQLSAKDLDEYDNFLFDADGVLWLESTPLPGAVNFLQLLASRGKKVFVITNNSTKTLDEYKAKIDKIGFNFIPKVPTRVMHILFQEQIICPSVVIAEHLSREKSQQPVYLIGTKSLEKMLTSAGVVVHPVGPEPFSVDDSDFMFEVDNFDPTTRAVVVSFDPHFSYPKLMRATNYVKQLGCEFLATNHDYTFPGKHKHVIVPGSGSIVASVEAAVGARAKLFGKPTKRMFQYLLRDFHIDPTRTIMFGDRLDTDIKFANRNAIKACLMLTGVHNLQDIRRAEEDGRHEEVPFFYGKYFADYLK